MIKENLNLYHIFYETAICGNISMAARKLYISQPAISKAISKLESSLGVSLFVRSSRGVKLTPDGEILLKQLDTAFHAIKQGEDTIESRKESGAGSLSIGISTTLCRYLLLPYLQDFIKAHPEVKLSIFCQSSTETIAALENGLLDMGIIGETSHLDPLHFFPSATSTIFWLPRRIILPRWKAPRTKVPGICSATPISCCLTNVISPDSTLKNTCF